MPWTLVLWIPVLIALLTVFGFGLATLVAPLAVAVRDTTNFLRFITRLWFFSTPIFYTVEQIPEGVLPFMSLNPLFPFFAMLEQMFETEPVSGVYVVWAACWALGTALAGTLLFLSRERGFAARL
ncbi:MAG: ABC transporter permease [Acidimicrobiia bacterium]|nr:ABC transporter permease [Acidimicrobiia bacterium]